MKPTVIVLVLVTQLAISNCSSSAGRLIGINRSVDESIETANNINVEERRTFFEIEKASIGNASFEGMTVLGLDSLRRSRGCRLIREDTRDTYVVHLGFGFLHFFFKRLNMDGNSFSATFKIPWNSFVLVFTTTWEPCDFKMERLYIERAWDIWLQAARPGSSGQALDPFFKNEVIPKINAVLDVYRHHVEELMREKYCEKKQFPNEENHFQKVLLDFLLNIIL